MARVRIWHAGLKEGDIEWWTPPGIIRSLGEFDLDPCAGSPRPWDTAKEHYDKLGSLLPWHGRVWLNPPYGNEIGYWLQRLMLHGNGISLTYARTSTTWFQENLFRGANAMQFLDKDIAFHYQNGEKSPNTAGQNMVLSAFGDFNVKALENCRLDGYLVRLNNDAND